jgi:aldehyde dehydrogenase (NAD+)
MYQLARLVQENHDTLLEALSKDLGRPKVEFLSEANSIVKRTLRVATLLDKWSAPEPVEVAEKTFESWQPTINKSPKGVVLIISCVCIPIL